MPTRIIKTYQKRIDAEGNDVLDENGEIIMDVIAETEEEYVEEEPTTDEILQSLLEDIKAQLVAIFNNVL
jgi:hypothetical protein